MSDEPLISIRSLRRTYRMGDNLVHALDGVDLDIRRGEFVAIIGPSGSGKSTLMYQLGCLDTPSAGSYRLAGHEVAALGDAALSRLRNQTIGFVFQAYHLLAELDVVQNVALPLTYRGVAADERRPLASRLAGALGLAERLGHRATELSGGQMQRVAIARALAARPELILADEPTGNLDSVTGRDIMAVIRRLHADGNTVVLVTHDPDVARQADRVVTIVDGCIVGDEAGDGAAEGDAERAAGLGAALPALAATRGQGAIRAWDLARMALREGLLAHKLRSFLTMLGIVFGIAAVIAMTAITEGGKEQQLEQIRQIGLNNIQVADAGLEGAQLLRARRLTPDGLSQHDLAVLRQHLPELEAATAWRHLRAELRAGDVLVEDGRVLGVTGAFREVVNYHLGRGRFLDARDAASRARVCVLGPGLVDELALTEPLGARLLLGDEVFTVVGVMQRKRFADAGIADISIPDRNRECYIPLTTLEQFFHQPERAAELDVISLRMASEEHLLKRSQEVRTIIDDRHRGAEDTRVFVPLEKLEQAQQTREVFNIIITVIAGISLLVGGIGIMNIMLATVTERTREIGIRRAIGASRRDILRQFLAESLLMAVCGGLLGIAGGIGGALLVEWFSGFPVAFDATIVGIAAGVSALVGVVFGLYPAWLAAQMDPVEALRS